MIPGIVASTRRGGEGFVFELPPFRPDAQFTQVYGESVLWYKSDYSDGGVLENPLDYFTQSSLDGFFLPPPSAVGNTYGSLLYTGQSFYAGDIDAGVLLKPLPEGAEEVVFCRGYCADLSDVVSSRGLSVDKEFVLAMDAVFDGIYINWETLDWVSESEWEDFYTFLGAKMFSVWDSEMEVWIDSLESGYFYSDDTNLIDRVVQNPHLFTKLRIIDWEW